MFIATRAFNEEIMQDEGNYRGGAEVDNGDRQFVGSQESQAGGEEDCEKQGKQKVIHSYIWLAGL
jgi:hypothetical protein